MDSNWVKIFFERYSNSNNKLNLPITLDAHKQGFQL